MLGVYPRVMLVEARERAVLALRQVDEGLNPSARRRQLNTRVESVCADYIRQYAQPRNRSWQETERILKREFVSVHGQQDIRKINRADILMMMDSAVDRGAAYQANRIHANLRKLFNWCLERGIVETNPLLGTRGPTKEEARDRVFNDNEVIVVLNACNQEFYPFRQFMPLLVATAQRRSGL